MPRTATALAFFALVALTHLSAPALAQTNFVPFETYWLGPLPTPEGIALDGTSSNFLIDTDGDGLIEAGEGSFPVPLAFQQTVASSQYRLSPSRQHLVLFGTAINGPCQGSMSYYVYRLAAVSGTPLELAGPPICADQGQAMVGFFDPLGSEDFDVFFVVENADFALEQEIWWKHLVDGTTSSGNYPLPEGVGEITFSPNGIAAFVQYEVGGGDNISSYQMIELCADDFGDYVGPNGGSVQDVTGGGVAYAQQINTTDVVVRHGITQAQLATYSLDDCSAPPDPIGACCLPDGSCSPGMTESACSGSGGTWQGAGVDCGSVSCPQPPSVQFDISATGPMQVQPPGQITYNLTYHNTGDLDAQVSSVVAYVPLNSSFDSASSGGSYNTSTNYVAWSLGTVPAQGSGQLSFTVDVACGAGDVVLDNYQIQSFTPIAFGVGTDVVTTTVIDPSGAPLTLMVSSVSDTGLPPEDSGTVTHTLTLVDTDGSDRIGLHFDIGVGSVWSFDGVIDDGGGTLTAPTNRVQWTGNVAANGSTHVVFRTKLPDCRSSYQSESVLNFGGVIRIYDACGAQVATAMPDTVDFAPIPIVTDVAMTGVGPIADDPYWGKVALARIGSSFEIQAKLTNQSQAAVSGASLIFVVPTEFELPNDPPWVGTPPAGAMWDSASRTASWSGSIAAQATITLRIGVQYPADGPCGFLLESYGSYGACSNASTSLVKVFGLPDPIAETHVLTITPFDGLFSYRPEVDSQQVPFLCASFEIHGGLGLGRNGDIWVAGTPTYRFNPNTLEIEFFSDEWFYDELQMHQPVDVAVDPDTGVVYFSGQLWGVNAARVVSYDPSNDQTAVLLDDALPSVHVRGRSIDVMADGRVAVTTGAGILIIDPTPPVSTQLWTDPSLPPENSLGAVAARPDGKVYTVDVNFTPSVPRALRLVDPDTGVFSVVESDLAQVILGGPQILGMDLADDGNLWMATNSLAEVDLSTSPATSQYIFGGLGLDYDTIWIAGSGSTAVGDPGSDGDPSPRPEVVALHAPVPNPFNPRTTIAFDLPQASQVEIVLFDVRGRRVRALLDGAYPAGVHQVVWDGKDDGSREVASGLYFVRMRGGGRQLVQKAMLLR